MTSFSAGGDIYPHRFVKQSTNGVVLQCGAGEIAYGISQKATRRSPYVDSSGKAAISGDVVGVYDRDGESCLLEIVAAVVLTQPYLKSDADGKGTPASSDQDDYGAIALQSGAAGDVIRVERHVGMRSGT
jgi:hypothetical protein